MNKASKAGQTTVQNPKQSKQRSLITKADALTGALDGLPWSEWSEDDRNDLVNALNGARNKIDTLLNEINPDAGEGEPAQQDQPRSSNLA